MSPSAAARISASAFRGGQPISALLELTYRCNWACVFCYNPRRHDRRALAAAEWETVLDGLRELGTLTVTLSGGEPLLHAEFRRIALAVRQRRLLLRVYTNGSLIDPATAAFLASVKPTSVESSLHGAVAETHDRATTRPGSFESLWRGVRLLKSHGVRMRLKTPLTSLNEPEIEEMVALAEAEDVDLRFDPVLTPRDDGDLGPLAYRASEAGLKALYARSLRQGPGSGTGTTRAEGDANCGLGRTTVVVDPEGNVFPCAQWRHKALGNVRETPLPGLWRGSAARLEAMDVSVRANDTLISMGLGAAQVGFCPALAAASGDPARPDADFVERVRIASESL